MGTTVERHAARRRQGRHRAHRRLPHLPVPRRRARARSPPTTPSCSASSTAGRITAEEADGAPAALGAHARARRRRGVARDRHRWCSTPAPATAGCSAPTASRASSSFDEIHEIMLGTTPAPSRSPTGSSRTRLDGGAPDNVTVVVVDIGDAGRSGDAAARRRLGRRARSRSTPARASRPARPRIRCCTRSGRTPAGDALRARVARTTSTSSSRRTRRRRRRRRWIVGLLDRAAGRARSSPRSCSATSGRRRTTSSASPTARSRSSRASSRTSGRSRCTSVYTRDHDRRRRPAHVRPAARSSRPSAPARPREAMPHRRSAGGLPLSDRRPARRRAPPVDAAHRHPAAASATARRSCATSSSGC